MLPLADHSEKAVIQYYNFNRDSVMKYCPEFLDCHLKTSVTKKSHNLFIWSPNFSANRGRKSKAHCSHTSRSYEAVWIGEFVITGH